MSKKQQDIIFVLCNAISRKRVIRFYYESTSSGKKEWRVVEPYIVSINDNGAGNVFLAALPTTELTKKPKDRITGHYLIKKMVTSKLEILNDTFDEPKVERSRIMDTPTTEAICRFR